MRSWEALPDHVLREAGEASTTLIGRGIRDYRAAGRFVHEIPYGRNSDRADYRLVLREGRGTCSTKHALLAAVAAEQRLAVVLTIGIYDMNEANTPGVGRILAASGLESIPEAHCYLTYRGERIDVTRSGVSPTAAISRFHREWNITPADIGSRKIALHQTYLREWLADRHALVLSFEELWRVREQCIQSLGVPEYRKEDDHQPM